MLVLGMVMDDATAQILAGRIQNFVLLWFKILYWIGQNLAVDMSITIPTCLSFFFNQIVPDMAFEVKGKQTNREFRYCYLLLKMIIIILTDREFRYCIDYVFFASENVRIFDM